VGAGPAGLALAREAAHAGRRVVILESGGWEEDPALDRLMEGSLDGEPYQDLRRTRARRIGGTSALWNTMYQGAAYAKYVPLDPIDFQAREWIPGSGWPFPRSELETWYGRAATLLGLGALDAPPAGVEALPFPDGSLISGCYRFGARTGLVGLIIPNLADAPDVTLVTGATATGLVASSAGRVSGVEWRAMDGAEGIARAERYVLAMGGIETPRFLLATTRGSSWLGRGFMEHPVDGSLTLATSAPPLCPEPGYYTAHEDLGGIRFGRIGLSEVLQRGERLPNASLRLVREEEPALLRSSPLLPAARRLVPFQGLRRLAGNLVRRLARTGRIREARYQLLIDLEQGPDPDNRITLSAERDPLGMPRAVLRWRWREEDRAHLARLHQVVEREFARAGLGTIRREPHAAFNPDSHHHLGATRMHRDPAQGVVDEQLQVHGFENLYAVGSSVFPAAGFANPTLTSVALAIRLAGHLGR
jgi:choline dehydrogenase-like flavoprotein